MEPIKLKINVPLSAALAAGRSAHGEAIVTLSDDVVARLTPAARSLFKRVITERWEPQRYYTREHNEGGTIDSRSTSADDVIAALEAAVVFARGRDEEEAYREIERLQRVAEAEAEAARRQAQIDAELCAAIAAGVAYSDDGGRVQFADGWWAVGSTGDGSRQRAIRLLSAAEVKRIEAPALAIQARIEAERVAIQARIEAERVAYPVELAELVRQHCPALVARIDAGLAAHEGHLALGYLDEDEAEEALARALIHGAAFVRLELEDCDHDDDCDRDRDDADNYTTRVDEGPDVRLMAEQMTAVAKVRATLPAGAESDVRVHAIGCDNKACPWAERVGLRVRLKIGAVKLTRELAVPQ